MSTPAEARLTPAYCAERAAAAIREATALAPAHHGYASEGAVAAWLGVADAWRELGAAMAQRMAMVPRPPEDDDDKPR